MRISTYILFTQYIKKINPKRPIVLYLLKSYSQTDFCTSERIVKYGECFVEEKTGVCNLDAAGTPFSIYETAYRYSPGAPFSIEICEEE